MKIYIDIDGVICTDENGRYHLAKPIQKNIDKIRKLYEAGHEIILWTGRGSETKIDWKAITFQQIMKWRVAHHELRFGKPGFDILIDDRSVGSIDEALKRINL